MAISTSGLAVPQVSTNYDSGIYQNQNMPKALTIGDMLDISKKSLDLNKAKETYEADVAGKKAESQRLQTEAQKAGIDLNMHTKNLSNGVYGGYLTDPDFLRGNSEQMVKKLKSARTFLEDNGLVPPNQGKGHDALLDLAKSDPVAAYQMIKNGVNQAGGAAQQFGEINRAPAAVSTGQGTQFVQTSPYQGGTNNQFVQGQIPIGTKQVAQPGDASGLPAGTEYLVGPQGQVQPVQPGAATPGAAQPGGVTPAQMNRPANQQGPVVTSLSPQTAANLELGNKLVNDSRVQAGKAVQIESAANQAIQLSQVTDTGQGAHLWNALKGNYVGIPDFDPAHPAANYQILGHVLTNETNLLAQNPAYGAGSMGGVGGTQKQIEQATQTAGKTEWNPEAIQYTSRYNRALAYGVQMFNHGVDQSQTISNRNPLYANDYQQKWNSNLNLDSIRLADAKRNYGVDPQGLTQITKELGGEKSARYKKAQEDLRVINGIATRGK